MSSCLYSSESLLDYKRVKRLFRNVDETLVSTSAPQQGIRSNQVYIYRVNVTTSNNYWRHDGLQWKNLRSHVHPEKDPWCRRITFQLVVQGRPQDFYRREFYPFGCKVGPPNNWITPYVIIQYSGSFDMEGLTSTTHGNKKDTPSKTASKIFREIMGESTPKKMETEQGPQEPVKKQQQVARKKTGGYYKKVKAHPPCPEKMESSSNVLKNVPESLLRQVDEEDAKDSHATTNEPDCPPAALNDEKSCETASPPRKSQQYHRQHPKVKQNIIDKLKENAKPSQVYREVVRDSVMSKEVENPSLTPRNLKQVYNIQHQLKNENTHDSFFETFLFGRQHPDIVTNFQLFPQLLMIQMHPDVNKHVESLQNNFRYSVFHYDTTFDIGTYYTSILSMRNPVFKNEPLIPVAAMFHETTSESCHETFFLEIRLKFRANNDRTIIVTDRETSITNAIKSQLPEATNLFCWNHIRKNVEDWAKKNISKEEAYSYKDDVTKLLKAESRQQYRTFYEAAVTSWDPKFKIYYDKFLEKDLKSSYRPVLENLEIYSEKSGITNNPAESTNAFLKRNLMVKNATLFQTLSVWYFFQVDIMMEICRGMQGEGNFVLAGKAPVDIYVPEKMEDLLPKELISSLVYEGKFPNNLPTSTPYKTESIAESTTLRGLAKFFINNDRVTLLPRNGTFVIRGLLGKTYMVDLKTGTCSCLRPKTCEHRFAAMMSAGVDGKITKRRCQPNLGNLYNRTARKATGKKRGQGFRLKMTLPKKPRLAIDTPKPLSLASENLSFKTTSEKEKDEPVSLSAKIAKLPVVTSRNIDSIMFHLPTGNIWFKELKPVQPTISKADSRLLLKRLEPAVNESTLTWMVDSVISGFLFFISDVENKGVISITATEALRLMAEENMSFLFSKQDGGDYHDWNGISCVLIPYLHQQNHWILIALKPRNKSILVVDPVAQFRLPISHQRILETLFNRKFNFETSTVWDVIYPKTSVSEGDTALQCGPYICFFAEAIVRGWSLMEMPDVKQYRNHIISTLVGNCRPFPDKRLKICYKCKVKVLDNLECKFCKQKIHQSCGKKIKARGLEFFVCR